MFEHFILAFWFYIVKFLIDVACFQDYLSVCWGSCKLGYPTTGEQLIKTVATWGDEKDGENELVLLSPGTASCLALVRGSLLQDYKWGICLTKYWKYYLWLNDVLGPDPIYCSGLHFTPWVLSSLRLSSYIPSKYLYNPVLGDVTMTRVSYWWLKTTILLNFIDLLLSELIHNFLS